MDAPRAWAQGKHQQAEVEETTWGALASAEAVLCIMHPHLHVQSAVQSAEEEHYYVEDSDAPVGIHARAAATHAHADGIHAHVLPLRRGLTPRLPATLL